MKTIEVVAAIICRDGHIFAAERGSGKYKDKWEFPGGKIEAGETSDSALIREIAEELDIVIEPVKRLTTINYSYPDFHLVMHCFICRIVEGEIKLVEHEAGKWLKKNELDSVDWLPADIEVVAQLKSYLNARKETI